MLKVYFGLPLINSPERDRKLSYQAISRTLGWGGELSADPRERARIQAYIQTAASIGIFLVLLLPALLDVLGRGGPRQRRSSRSRRGRADDGHVAHERLHQQLERDYRNGIG